jgi:hypothetical protein
VDGGERFNVRRGGVQVRVGLREEERSAKAKERVVDVAVDESDTGKEEEARKEKESGRRREEEKRTFVQRSLQTPVKMPTASPFPSFSALAITL